jgi:hypothetical protein
MENSTVAINGTVTAKNLYTYLFVSHLLSYQYQLAHNATYVTVTKQLVIRTREFIALSLCISQTGEDSLLNDFFLFFGAPTFTIRANNIMKPNVILVVILTPVVNATFSTLKLPNYGLNFIVYFVNRWKAYGPGYSHEAMRAIRASPSQTITVGKIVHRTLKLCICKQPSF